jgi:hypothetical protein
MVSIAGQEGKDIAQTGFGLEQARLHGAQRYASDGGYVVQTMACAVNQLKYQALVGGEAGKTMGDPIPQLAMFPGVGRRRQSLSEAICIDKFGTTSV